MHARPLIRLILPYSFNIVGAHFAPPPSTFKHPQNRPPTRQHHLPWSLARWPVSSPGATPAGLKGGLARAPCMHCSPPPGFQVQEGQGRAGGREAACRVRRAGRQLTACRGRSAEWQLSACRVRPAGGRLTVCRMLCGWVVWRMDGCMSELGWVDGRRHQDRQASVQASIARAGERPELQLAAAAQ